MGRGKGYYDKYLNQYKHRCDQGLPYLIGLAFKEQIFDSIPVSDTDYQLDEIIYDGCEYLIHYFEDSCVLRALDMPSNFPQDTHEAV